MSSTILLIVLLSAHITCLISEQLFKATVGGSVLINCSLPEHPLTFYWQWQEGKEYFFHWENGKRKQVPNNKYENRSQIFPSEFSSGNISFRLDNISVEDDEKIFFAIVNLYKEPNIVTKSSQEKQCRSMLQVSAPYQDLVLTVNHTTNTATCSARGGYPAARVSWKGLNRTSDKEQDLQDAETFLQQDPTEKNFSFTSSVDVTGFKSVTCIVYNPHSYETVNRTEKIDTGEIERIDVAAIVVPVVLVILVIVIVGAVLFYLWYKKQHPDINPDAAREPVDPNPQDPDQGEAPAQDQAQCPDQDQDPDQAPGPDQDQDQALGPDQVQDPDQAPGPDQDQDQAQGPDQDQDPDQAPDPDPANQPPVEHDPQDGAQAEDAAEPAQDPVQEEAADPSEDTVLLSEDRVVYHCQTKTSEGTADCDTCEDTAASPEKEKLLEKENGNEDSASD